MPREDWPKLGILYDSKAIYSPSNQIAIDKFCESAIKYELDPVILKKDELWIPIDSYIGLFIRDTTHPGNHTYEWANLAAYSGKKVIDSPMSIQQGCNKLWQAQLFLEYNISHPRTWKDRYYSFLPGITRSFDIDNLIFPCVIKIPDSCFSQGVFKCINIDEYIKTLKHISQLNCSAEAYVACQEFIETKFDWRITIFNHKFLFAVKYYMVDKDWKIIKYDRKGNYIDGKHECVRFEDIPLPVLLEADKCNKLLTDGLYGIDIKEHDGKAYVIEINDNPSIDGGVEDEIEGDGIYDTIINWFTS